MNFWHWWVVVSLIITAYVFGRKRSWADRLRFLLSLAFVTLCTNVMIIVIKDFNLKFYGRETIKGWTINLADYMHFMRLLAFECLLIFFTTYLIIAYFKGGYKNLKRKYIGVSLSGIFIGATLELLFGGFIYWFTGIFLTFFLVEIFEQFEKEKIKKRKS
jgi:hypothetical protein